MNMSMSRIGVLSVLTLILGAAIMTFVTSSALLAMFTQAVVYAISALGVGFLLRQSRIDAVFQLASMAVFVPDPGDRDAPVGRGKAHRDD